MELISIALATMTADAWFKVVFLFGASAFSGWLLRMFLPLITKGIKWYLIFAAICIVAALFGTFTMADAHLSEIWMYIWNFLTAIFTYFIDIFNKGGILAIVGVVVGMMFYDNKPKRA